MASNSSVEHFRIFLQEFEGDLQKSKQYSINLAVFDLQDTKISFYPLWFLEQMASLAKILPAGRSFKWFRDIWVLFFKSNIMNMFHSQKRFKVISMCLPFFFWFATSPPRPPPFEFLPSFFCLRAWEKLQPRKHVTFGTQTFTLVYLFTTCNNLTNCTRTN